MNNPKLNQTEAPTNEGTLENVTEQFTPMSEEKTDFVTIVAQHHAKYGTLMTLEVADERYGIPPKTFKKFMKDERVLKTLEQFDIDIKRYNLDGSEAWRSHSLTPVQMVTANAMLNLIDTRSEKKKLSDCGVTPAQWQAWLRDPVFSDYLKQNSELLLQNSQHEASLALMDRVRAGDPQALKLYLEYTGRFVSKSDGAGNSNQDIQSLITSIIEIIIDEVEDSQTAVRIAERLKVLSTSRNVANSLLGNDDPIVVPEVQKARELSPHMKDLVEQGRGISDF